MADNDDKATRKPDGGFTPAGEAKPVTVDNAKLDQYMLKVRGIRDYVKNNDRFVAEQNKRVAELQKDVLDIEKLMPSWEKELQAMEQKVKDLTKAERDAEAAKAAEDAAKYKDGLRLQALAIKKLNEKAETEEAYKTSAVKGRDEARGQYIGSIACECKEAAVFPLQAPKPGPGAAPPAELKGGMGK